MELVLSIAVIILALVLGILLLLARFKWKIKPSWEITGLLYFSYLVQLILFELAKWTE